MSTTATRGRHRRATVVLPAPPNDQEKASYAWRSLPFLTCALVVSATCVIAAQAWFEYRNPIALPFVVYTLLYFIYQAVSLPVNFTGHSFDLSAHELRVMAWRPRRYPSVDVLLPICGEPTVVLGNTWEGVAEMRASYPGPLTINVMDDGPSDEAAELARAFGFNYVRQTSVSSRRRGTSSTPSNALATSILLSSTQISGLVQISSPRRCPTWMTRQ